jgi:SAM-dependent methyltransferase
VDTQMISKRLWSSPIGAAVAWRMLWPVVRAGGPIGVDADVLHIGCGNGRVTEALALAHPQWRITALDSSPSMIAAAHRRLYRYGPRMKVTRADPPDLPYPDAHFDLIIAVHVWHRLSAWRAVTVQTARVLRPKGILVLADTPTAQMGRRVTRHRGSEDGATLTPVKVAVTAAGLTLIDTVALPGLGYRLMALHSTGQATVRGTPASSLDPAFDLALRKRQPVRPTTVSEAGLAGRVTRG